MSGHVRMFSKFFRQKQNNSHNLCTGLWFREYGFCMFYNKKMLIRMSYDVCAAEFEHACYISKNIGRSTLLL